MKKQIIIHTDPETHRWLKGEAKRERRTLGNQVLALILGLQESATPASAATTSAKRTAASKPHQ